MTSSNAAPHIPIMVHEVISNFDGADLKVFFDGTLGAGGHARAILEAHPEIRRYIGCDNDPEALEIARKNLAPWADKLEFVHGNFSRLDEYMKELNVKAVDGFFLTSECPLCS
jgi:16S rRNA (cytosine1402-N4)-methyltransferase